MSFHRAMHALATAITRRPIATLALLAVLLAPLLVAAGGVRPDNALASWFVEGDPALGQYRAFLREFGNDEAVLVGFDTPGGARSAEELALQQRLAGRLAAIDGIERVLAGGTLPPQASAGLVARDGRATAIVAWLAVRADIERSRGRIIADVRAAADEALRPLGRSAHLAGNGVLYEGLNQQTMRDTGVFLSLALVAMVVLLAAGLRNARAVALALVAPLVAAAAGIGVLGLAGRPFTVVGSALPTLTLVIALADAIHVLLHYEQMRRAAPPADREARRRQVADAIAWVAVPCFFTALTTAGGFLALGTSRIALVRDFGIFAAIGMMLAWAITLVFLGAALALWDVRPPRRGTSGGWIQRALDAYARAVPRRRWPVIGATLAMTAILAAGATRLEADTDTIGLLPRDHVVRRDSDWLEARLGAYTPLEMRVTSAAGVRDPAFASQLRTWRARAAASPGVERTFSAIDFAPSPQDSAARGYVSADGRAVRVTAYVPMTTARGMERAADALEREGTAVFGREGAVQATGYLPLYVRITDYIVQSTISGLASSFVLVFALMALLIRSPLGLAAALPVNVLPVLLVFGVMGWAGIPLDIATATVGAIVLGIVVDDTIHFLHRFEHERQGGVPPARAATDSLREAGNSIVLTSLVLACGFAVMIAAGTKSIAYFGLVATLAILGAMFADLLLLPALLSFARGGGRPGRSPTEAHIDAA